MSRNKNVHLTGLAITLDSQQRVATAQKQWVGQLACFGIAPASSQLAPQAVAGVHDRHITAGHREFDRRLYLFHPMVAIQLSSKLVGNIVGAIECAGIALCRLVFGPSHRPLQRESLSAVEHGKRLAAQLGKQRRGNEDTAHHLSSTQLVDCVAQLGQHVELASLLRCLGRIGTLASTSMRRVADGLESTSSSDLSLVR